MTSRRRVETEVVSAREVAVRVPNLLRYHLKITIAIVHLVALVTRSADIVR